MKPAANKRQCIVCHGTGEYRCGPCMNCSPAASSPSEPVAEVVWFDPSTRIGPEKPGKIIDASLAFMDDAPLGTKLYAAPVVTEEMVNRALDAAEFCRNPNTQAWMRKALIAALANVWPQC